MRGAVAAGHPYTAQAGARILEEGGNAVDACVAAGFVSWVAESPLTGPGAGGFMLVHRARDASDRILDFFVEVPGRGLSRGERAAMDVVQVAFSRDALSAYRVGGGSCAVPGAVAGLAEAHRLYGSLPWAELVAPAISLARAGVELNPAQAIVHAILDPVLRREDEGRRIYGVDACLAAGSRIAMADLADTLEQLADEGADAFYRGDLGDRIVRHVGQRGGRITRDDLAAYRVVRRAPVRVPYRGLEFVSNPPPSAGGVLIAYALRIRERLGAARPPGSADEIAAVVEVMREASLARDGGFASALHRGGLARRLLAPERIEAAVTRARSALREPAAETAGAPSTTHVSVVDAAGNAASLSASTGTGSGVVVPGTGIHVNNMLGEEDVNRDGARVPGRRLPSMMAPSLLLENGRPRLVVGSAGSIRLRAAILQIVANVVDHGMTAEDALGEARVHLNGARVELEAGYDPAAADALEARGYEVVRWSERNIYFGGASAVAETAPGELEAAGDPRRGGLGIVVA